MSSVNLSSRTVLLALVLATAATSGCGWFRKGDRLYSAQTRPLEVPPDLDTSATATATAGATVSASAAQRAAATAQAANGFAVPGTRDEVYTRVGEALAGIQGVTIASRAQLLGAYDVGYGGSSFLVRVSAAESGAFVSAVDPRGLPATGEAPRRLIDALRTALAR